MKKKLLSLALALVMCLALTAPAFAADFVIQNGVLTEYKGAGGDVTVPDGVTRIGDYAFERNKAITSVVLPNSVTSIGYAAFKDCWNLKSINIPSGVTSIGSFAFEWCSSLAGDIVIPSGVTSIGDFTFSLCSALTSVTLPDGLKSIGKNAFAFTTFTSIDIPDSVESIGESAFASSKITHITVPASMTVIGEGAFASCDDLSSITIHNRVTRIEENAFTFCVHLTSIEIPESVTYIAAHAFASTGLTSFTFPSGITEISERLFSASTGLASVTIPAGVTAIRNGAFWDCGLKDIYFGGSESQWAAITIENEDPFEAHPTAIPRRTVIHYNETAGPSSNPVTPSNPAVTPSDPVTPTGPAAPSNQVTPADPATGATGFTDVAADAYYAAPVTWAVGKGITKGTDEAAKKFSPGQNCTNAQILTFLWRAYGQPEPTIGNPYANSIPDAYTKAAVWAYEKGMVSGTAFDVDKPCTRAMAVTYMWQAAGSPTPSVAASFVDVPAGSSYAPAVAWAVEKGITKGTNPEGTMFSPEEICNRGQIVTFLHRNLA